MENETIIRPYSEAVDITVKWWSEKAFKTPLNQNNGDNSSNGGMAFALMNMLSASITDKVEEVTIQKFESKLRDLLLDKNPNEGMYATMCDVDYHPNQILSEACEFAGVDSNCLPCKTFTYITKNNELTGRYQYGGEWFTI